MPRPDEVAIATKDEEPVYPPEAEPYRLLLLAVLQQAVEDARRDDQWSEEARTFLRDRARLTPFCELVGLDVDWVLAWVLQQPWACDSTIQ